MKNKLGSPPSRRSRRRWWTESRGQFRAVALTALGLQRILAALYRVDNSDPTLPFFNEKTQGVLDSRIMLAETNDGGVTWPPPTLMDTTPFTGPVLRLPNGEWVCQFETNKTNNDTSEWMHASVLMFLRDGGRTWPRHTVVTRDPHIFYWDQRSQVLPDGRLLDVFWTYDCPADTYRNIHGCDSADGGRTWPADTTLSLYESVLPSQTVRKDGMVDAWAEMDKFTVGLPATAALPNGDYLVVYYAGSIADCMSVMRARIEA